MLRGIGIQEGDQHQQGDVNQRLEQRRNHAHDNGMTFQSGVILSWQKMVQGIGCVI